MFDYVRYKQLNWYGHLRRMNEEKLPQKNLNDARLEEEEEEENKDLEIHGCRK